MKAKTYKTGKTSVAIALVTLLSVGMAMNMNGQNGGPCALNNDTKVGVVSSSTGNISEENYYSFYLKGIELDNNGDYDFAVIEFNKAIKLNPNFAEAYDRRGMVYVKLIKYRKAIKDFNKAIELNLQFAEAYNHLGIALYCNREFDLAIISYNKAIEIAPDYAKVYYNRAIVKLEINDGAGANNDLLKASELKVTEATNYLSMTVEE
jgi:tetratricopeptide (TPR) repeat protein